MNFIVDLKIYPYDIMFSFGETNKQLYKTLDKYKIPYDEQGKSVIDESDGKYRTIMFPTGQTLVRIAKKPKQPNEYAVVVHEIYHAVNNVMRNIGMTYSADSEEAYAYCIQYVTQEVLTILWRK